MGTTSKGEKPKIEEFSAYPLCTFEINQSGEWDLHDMMKEGEYQDYIESWFQEVTQTQYHSFLQYLLIQKKVSHFIFYIQVISAINISYVYRGIFFSLLCSWLHWKSSYTRIEIFSFFLGRIGKYVYK